jgi:nitroreductase
LETFDAIRTVLAVRKFDGRPIPDETLQRIVEAGWLTGSASNRQPWHFVVVRDRETIERLSEIARTGPYMTQAPVVVAVATAKSPFGLSDASRAIQSMMLAAWSEGVGSNWVGFSGRLEEINPVLDLPDDFDVVAVLPFGYPAENIGRGKKRRKALGEVASNERFGRPFA